MPLTKKKTKTVLILMTDKHLGNLVVSLPAIHELKEFFKGDDLHLVVDSAYLEIAETIDGLANILYYPRQEVQDSKVIRRVWKFLKFAGRLRRLSPDITIDLDGRQVPALFTLIAGAPLRIGSSSADLPHFYNEKVNVSPGKHRVYRYLEMASAVGAGCDSGSFRLKATEAKRVSLKNKLSGIGIKTEKPIVCIHPGAGRMFREWTSKGFSEVSDWLSAEGFQVVIIGGKGDLNKINDVLSLSGRSPYNLGGDLSLGELIALLEISSLYIGNDTGPLHIAAAVGTLPVIGLFFRPGAETTWYPFTQKSIVLKGDAGCQKCKGRHCQYDFKCIGMISSDDVKHAVERLMNE
jgi:ADP-heptose:LPS heptosyltransferase